MSNQGIDTGVREIGKVQTNAVAFVRPDGKLSWLWWPKAKDVQVEGDSFTILKDGQPLLRYSFVE